MGYEKAIDYNKLLAKIIESEKSAYRNKQDESFNFGQIVNWKRFNIKTEVLTKKMMTIGGES